MNDKFYGMFYGALIGDALGLPYERRGGSKKQFDGIIKQYSMFNRFTKTTKTFALGQSSDDGEMMIALLNALLESDGEYNKETATMSYLDWANSGNPCLGKNTRALFRGVKTLNGYKKRFEKIYTTDEQKEASQSNGTLMRCLGLALIGVKDFEKAKTAIEQDVSISNPSNYTIYIETKFIKYVIKAIKGVKPTRVEEEELTVTGKDKGWCYYAYTLALQALVNTNSFEQGLNWIIQKGGDTDTNGCVGGMLLGAYYGLAHMKTEEITGQNIKIIKECSPNRPEKYTPKHGMSVLKKLLDLLEIDSHYRSNR